MWALVCHPFECCCALNPESKKSKKDGGGPADPVLQQHVLDNFGGRHARPLEWLLRNIDFIVSFYDIFFLTIMSGESLYC